MVHLKFNYFLFIYLQ